MNFEDRPTAPIAASGGVAKPSISPASWFIRAEGKAAAKRAPPWLFRFEGQLPLPGPAISFNLQLLTSRPLHFSARIWRVKRPLGGLNPILHILSLDAVKMDVWVLRMLVQLQFNPYAQGKNDHSPLLEITRKCYHSYLSAKRGRFFGLAPPN